MAAPAGASDGLSGQAEGALRITHAGPGQADSPPQRKWSRRVLKNWRVRSRLLVLVAIPTASSIALGGFGIVSSVQSEQVYQRVQHLAALGQADSTLIQALQDEQDHTAYYIALAGPGGRVATLSFPPKSWAAETSEQLGVQYAATDRALSRVRALAGQTGSSYPAQVRLEATTALVALGSLPSLRAAAADTKMPVLAVVTQYGQIVDDLIALNDDIAQGVGDPVLAQTVSVLGQVSHIKEEASQQRAILAAALVQGAFGPGELNALQSAVSAQQTDLQSFDATATPGQLQLWNADVAASFGNQASADELIAISLANKSGGTGSLGSDPTTADDWYSTMTSAIEYQIGPVEQRLAASVITRAAALRRHAIITAVEVAAIVLLILMLASLFTGVIARSMVGPLRTLRAGALEVAGLRLPEAVRRMSERDGESVSADVEPINVDSSDEIGEVARAFDQVHREALRLAATEAALRGNVNAMFVNLSRRSQSLVERQIKLIDDLEQGEQDPERLANLFQMDHLATRMRRNSENLLVLAGQGEVRRLNQSAALVDVLRAALSEIEHYERVTLNVQPGIALRGHAVSDVVHLTAELVENATALSAADTPVTIAGHRLSTGGVILEVTDQGVGMGAEEMAHANWRLDNPPAVDVSVSRRMGLFVVARLAARHGIRVRLRTSDSVGLTALVWLPDEVVVHETPGGAPGVRHGGPAAEAAFGPVGNGAATLANDARTTGRGDAGRASARREVNLARMPRFAPLREDSDDTGVLGPKRVPGAGPRPGSDWETTGPLSAFRASPTPVADSGFTATGQHPAVGADNEPAAELPGRRPGPESPAASPDFGFLAGSQAGDSGAAESPHTSPQPVLSVPATDLETGSSRGEVIVPPAAGPHEGHRLPIFEAVESDWFRRGRQAIGMPSHAAESAGGWVSPADPGWRAAQAVHAPSSDGVTTAGLPKRVPKANLVPGAVGAAGSSPPPRPARSAAQTRERFSRYQRGSRLGRAQTARDGSGDGEDEASR